MKKAKENWIGEQCSEIEENLRKNNSKGHTNFFFFFELCSRALTGVVARALLIIAFFLLIGVFV